MRALEVTLQVKGLSIERGLQRAAEAGIRLERLRRVDARTVSVRVQAQDEAELTQQLEQQGYSVFREREAEAQRIIRLLKRRALLGVGAAIFSLLVFAASACIWRVEISGAGAAEGEIRRLLLEEDVARGRLKGRLDAAGIQAEIERRLPQIKYVDVRMKGMTFSVVCAQARDAAPAENGGEQGNLYAAKDGIITQMIVRSGTPKVRRGDAVFAGQLLVEGSERGEGGEPVPVAARAQIQAQTFYEGAASVPAWTLHTAPTGRHSRRTVLGTPWGTWPTEEKNPFALSDVEKTVMPIGGGLWPVWWISETITEVDGKKIPRDRATMEVESEQIATQIAGRNIPIGAEVVDKWVDYSMIEEGFCAQVVLTCLEDIASAQTQNPT